MSRSPRTVFVERRTYRRRRLSDAARLLPVFGAFLFLVPILWASDGDGSGRTSAGGLYLFAVWGVLIVIAGLMSRRLMQPDPGEAETEPPE